MSTLSDQWQREVEEKAKPKKRKSTKKRDENGKFVKADESQNRNICLSDRRCFIRYP